MTDKEPDIWGDDRLGRSEDAAYIQQFLIARIGEQREAAGKQSYVLNIDAGWGYGKTFFLTHLADDLRAKGHLVAYVNAWRDDFSEDPLVAVMSAINEELEPYLRKPGLLVTTFETVRDNFGAILWAGAKGAGLQLARRAVGAGADEIAAIAGQRASADMNAAGVKTATQDALNAAGNEAVRALADRLGEKSIEEFKEAKNSVLAFKEQLEKLVAQLEAQEDVPPPLFVLVDELDRCRPPFAILMLERIKHLFDANNVVFIVATDTEQLQHSVKAVYGLGFGAAGYLTRFFDRTYRFDIPKMRPFIEGLMQDHPIDLGKIAYFDGESVAHYIADTLSYLRQGLREGERAYEIVRTIATTWTEKSPIQIGALLPLAVAHVAGVEPALRHDLMRLVLGDKAPGEDGGFRLKYRDEATFNMSEAHVSPKHLFDTYQEMGNAALPSIGNIHGTGPVHDYVRSQALGEFAIKHGNSFHHGSEPYWTVRAYPSIVRKAGRFAEADASGATRGSGARGRN